MIDEQKNTVVLSKEILQEIDTWVEKYPPDQKQSAVLFALTLVQEKHGGWLTEALMDAVADYLGMPRVAVYEVATFYSMYDLKPVGRHKIHVCNNISCMLRNSDEVIQHLENKLDIKVGQTTADGKFTLKTAECLAACANAPMMQIDKTYYEDLTKEKIDKILEQFD
ncbi:MAG: NADH-quinone oxidoreductase subunit NuoE [Proteobacteria bacterium]|nr:NADH-quinone oxidoreductase subunit NuoE [Pseudomonadota bacterium]